MFARRENIRESGLGMEGKQEAADPKTPNSFSAKSGVGGVKNI